MGRGPKRAKRSAGTLPVAAAATTTLHRGGLGACATSGGLAALCLLLAGLVFLPGRVWAETGAADSVLERRTLFAPESAKEWSSAESTLEPSSAHAKSGKSAFHWHVTVDYFGGEPNYPVGWPRTNHAIPAGPARDWSGWDFLHFWVYTETSRAALPREPVGLILYTPDREGEYHRTLTGLKKNDWVEITIPLQEIPRHHDVRLIQFYLSESRYQHKDELDLYIDDLALVRYAKPALLDFAAERAVLYADEKRIPVRFQLRGVKPDETQEVRIELRSGGRVAAQALVKTGRGSHRALLDTGGHLEPGVYDLVARLAGGAGTAAAPVRLVESPWK